MNAPSHPEIRFQSFNPYESRYPALRVVPRETLHLIKYLRSEGFTIVVEPDDATELAYLMEKGVREVLADPIIALLIGVPLNFILNLLATWTYDLLKRQPKTPEACVVLQFDDDGNTVRYSERGERISDDRFRSLLSALDTRKRNFAASESVTPPDPVYRLPIHLEHAGRIVGWSRGFVFDDEKREIRLEATRITDAKTSERIRRGELRGFSVAGVVHSSVCSVCHAEYVDCNHISGTSYHGDSCVVTVNEWSFAEVSIVKDPIQPLARVELSHSDR